MCGFAGVLTAGGMGAEELEAAAGHMADTLAHRGPDDRGVWTDADAGIALGFRRLSIIDLSPSGHQPMRSPSGRYTIVFNGEVYNHGELQRELSAGGARFRGHSDTEVILAAVERWGLTAAVRRFVGMFAIALWDAERRTLSLVRDRLGIKPLFIHRSGGTVTFGSELKAIAAGPGFDPTLDPDAIDAYLRYLYIPAPRTVYRQVSKLSPGQILVITDPSAPLPDSEPFWSASDVATRGLADPFTGSDEEAIDALEERLVEAVELRMHADVPLGALLSGGIDSSTVVALMQRISARPVKTFSIGFDEKEHDESPHAARVARHLGTDHTEVMLSGREAIEVVARLPEMFDEPLADPSQIPTYLISAVARREVTVALTGDGGDEVFGGYNRYLHGERMMSRLLSMPAPLRRAAGKGMGSITAQGWDRAYRAVRPLLPASRHHRLPGEKLSKLGRMMAQTSPSEMYRSLISFDQRSNGAPDDVLAATFAQDEGGGILGQMMLFDQLVYLPDDLLAKVDRASMAASLEARVPLLDHRVVEFGWRLPRTMKIRDGETKWILRRVLDRYLPRELIERPKVGFSVPVGSWLRGPLREWAEALLTTDGQALAIAGADQVSRRWTQVLGGNDGEAIGMWAILLLIAWEEHWVGTTTLTRGR